MPSLIFNQLSTKITLKNVENNFLRQSWVKDLLKIDPVFDTEFKLKEVAKRNPPDRLRMMASLFSMIKKKK